ncbi:hypothetical protein DERF_006189 [Dermatophagoides farinae]|uniref:Uncharacterized protein n=1 Tax=Dermatophagoides farinae TaxID=6954 RepID=A0A922L7X4_DERFA|nr:hypothetical protein DERF_006189 [Dermatophagoides farinae]
MFPIYDIQDLIPLIVLMIDDFDDDDDDDYDQKKTLNEFLERLHFYFKSKLILLTIVCRDDEE